MPACTARKWARTTRQQPRGVWRRRAPRYRAAFTRALILTSALVFNIPLPGADCNYEQARRAYQAWLRGWQGDAS